tara:strand:+ start:1087 stop:2112 length:1026 start_codon:yes stop_codon:yes gene_type:complete
MKLRYIYILIAIGTSNFLMSQQDPHSSVWFQSRALVNPAAVATEVEDFSFYTNFRYQYFTMDGQPMRTNSFAGEFRIPDKSDRGNHFGVGLNVYNDQTGDLKFVTNSISIPINYTLNIDFQNKLSIGICPGFFQQSFDPAAQTWENMWNGNSFDPTIPNNENFRNAYSTLDFGTGMFYEFNIRDKSRYYAGINFKHLTAQKIDFSFSGNKLYPLLTVHAGADIVTKKRNMKISPQFVYFKNGPNHSFCIGTSAETLIDEGSRITTLRKSKSIQYGFFYRYNDAIVSTFGVNISGFKVGLAFDATVSNLNESNKSIGAIELYMKYSFMNKTSNGKKKKKKDK